LPINHVLHGGVVETVTFTQEEKNYLNWLMGGDEEYQDHMKAQEEEDED